MQTATNTIGIQPTLQPRVGEIDFDQLEFGKDVADHMFMADYKNGEWQSAKILPFGNITMNPATLALHYGQTVFEGMKAFRLEDGRINIFRIDKHYDRFVKSLERLCMAVPPVDLFKEGLIRLVETDREWVPSQTGSSLYIRPFIYASEARFGVKISAEYRFIIFTGPVPALYETPIKVKVETGFIRAAKGGTGYAKCGGNYGGAFYPTQQARLEGYEQVIWTDGGAEPAIEESGMMNILFVIDNVLVTPPLSDSILDGVTRDSLLTLAAAMGYQVEQRAITVKELKQGFVSRSVSEAFGAGTAAVVAPIQTIHIDGLDYHLPQYTNDSLLYRMKQKLEAIRTGREEDVYGWNYLIN